ncbi:MAG: 3-oxoacid CoA-transferase subunit A [Gammaproteobacteria bacterium]|nr:3-oxoacid CoA-transferase subunit A [Gammaproteobacteria bacterium]
MIDKRVSTIAQALDGLSDGACIMVSGFGGAGVPGNLMHALDALAVKDLTIIVNSLRVFDGLAPGVFGERRVRKAVCSAARGRLGEPASYEVQWSEGSLDIEMSPQGSFAERIRAGGAGIAAFYTPTGVGTALTDGKEIREFDGVPHALETALTADFALIRGHVADRLGNVGFRGSQMNFGPAMAAAAKVAVVEVDEISEQPLAQRMIDVPGIYVDRVIALPDRR